MYENYWSVDFSIKLIQERQTLSAAKGPLEWKYFYDKILADFEKDRIKCARQLEKISGFLQNHVIIFAKLLWKRKGSGELRENSPVSIPLGAAKGDRNNLKKAEDPLIPHGICEQYSQINFMFSSSLYKWNAELTQSVLCISHYWMAWTDGRRNFKDTNPLMSSTLATLFGVVKQFCRI
jgi:hypothetical protein